MNNDTLQRVIACISETTRYPISLLKPEADIETDLGIDSVKRVEIVIALGLKFKLPLESEERDPAIRTINDISNWIQRHLDDANGQSPQAKPAQSVIENRVDAPVPPSAPAPSMQFNASQMNGQSASRLEAISPRPSNVPTASPQFKSASMNGQTTDKPFVSQVPIANQSTDGTLHGKVALVTGSGRGIGRTTARLLASRGATVVINSFHSREQGDATAAQICREGGNAIHLWGSIAKADHVEGIFDQIKQRLGGLDILVCNSSDGQIGSFMDLKHDDWERAFGTNVIGHHHCARLAFPMMRARGGGAMVTMSAVGAHHYVDGLGSQGVAKAAVESMTKYLACEAGHFGIRVNCVAGGPVYGDLISKFPGADEARNRWENTSPDGELTSPLDLAKTIAFLVSDDARGINGAIWTVDHGFSAAAAGARHAGRQSSLV